LKTIRIKWTCSNYCKTEHKYYITAWLHGRYLKAKHKCHKFLDDLWEVAGI